MKRILRSIGWCIGSIASLLAIFEFIAKRSIFFRPLWFYLNQNIEIKFGIVFLLGLLTVLLLILWIYNRHSSIKRIKRLENTPAMASNKEWKTSFEEFPEEGILYALEYPLGKEDVEPWIHKSDPRCLKCRTGMKKVPVHYDSFTSPIWRCESCGYSIKDDKNIKLQTQAESRLVKRLNNRS
jgi:ribosomal protein L37AE/L43A